MKTKSNLSAYILGSSTRALLFSCVMIVVCSAINLPQQPLKAISTSTGFSGAVRTLSFAERVAYQTAIEDVYWRHRVWPKTNPGPKPSLNEVMSQADIQKKVTDYLRGSQALEDYWQRPITADQLQAEMERMASNTKQPEVLQELFEALGNDPFVVAECLTRPILAERLVNRDLVVATPLRRVARNVPPASSKLRQGRQARGYSERPAQLPVTMAAVNRPYQLPVVTSPSGCTWLATTLTNAPAARYDHTAVWTGSEMIVWGGFNGSSYLNTGGQIRSQHRQLDRYNHQQGAICPILAHRSVDGQ